MSSDRIYICNSCHEYAIENNELRKIINEEREEHCKLSKENTHFKTLIMHDNIALKQEREKLLKKNPVIAEMVKKFNKRVELQNKEKNGII